MKKFLYSILFSFPFILNGQTNVGILYEEMPFDTTIASIRNHSSVLPAIRQANSSLGLRKTEKQNYINVGGLIDLGYRYTNYSEYKGGIGFSVESNFAKKWYFRLMAIGSIASKDSLFEPKSYFKFKEKDYSIFADVRARIAYTPNQFFHFQVGLDQHFIGEGSRSLFLSDYGKPYPYGQMRLNFWRIEYTMLYQFFREEKGNQYLNKYAVSHYLSFNAAKWLNIGIFESVIFQPKDTLFNRGYDVEYLNPFVFYRPQEYSLGSADNVLLGLSFYSKLEQTTLYGQLILDEFLLKEIRNRSKWWANKYGVQLGIKNHSQIGNTKIFSRAEMNIVRPYTYAHVGPGQNYGHQSSALAHPYGSSFAELLGEVKVLDNKYLLKFFGSYYLRGGRGDSLNFGENIYTSYINRPFEYGHKIGQGNGYNGVKLMLTFAYNLFKYNHWQVFTEQHFNYNTLDNRWFYVPVVGIRSQLWNDHRNY